MISDQDPKPQLEAEKHQRVTALIKTLRTSPAATTAVEAHEQIFSALKKIEGPLLSDDGKVRSRMKMSEFKYMFPLAFAGRTVYFELRRLHAVFIGTNGAIDIRERDPALTPEELQANPALATTKMTPVLEKPGADGRKVWDPTTS